MDISIFINSKHLKIVRHEPLTFRLPFGGHGILWKRLKIVPQGIANFFFFKYGGHAATLLVYFIFRGARAEDQLGTALQQHNALPVGYVATLCGLRRHPKTKFPAPKF